MRTVGLILAVVGVLMLIGGLVNAFKIYDLSDTHDLSKFGGAMAVSFALIAVGLKLKGKKVTI